MKIYNYLRKRGLALFLALVMCLSLLPAQAMAEALTTTGETGDGQTQGEWNRLTAEQIKTALKLMDERLSFTAAQLLEAVIDGQKVTALGTSTDPAGTTITEIMEGSERQTFYISGDSFTTVDPAETQNPEPTTYTVTYTDGVEDVEVFPDQVYTVEEGNSIPAFNGTPTREGWTFNGWFPEVALAVTANITYTAQWKEVLADPIPTDGNEDSSTNGTDDSVLPNAQDVVNAASTQEQGNAILQTPVDTGLESGEIPEEPQFVEQKEILAASAPEPTAPIYLWAKFEEEPVVTGSDNVEILSITVQNADNSGTATDLMSDVDFTVNYETTVRLRVSVKIAQSLKDKHIRIDVPADFQVVSYSQAAAENDAINQIAAVTFTRTPLGDWGTYRPKSGIIDFTLKEKSEIVEVFVDLLPDRVIWSKGNTNEKTEENSLVSTWGKIKVDASAAGQATAHKEFGAKVQGFGRLDCELGKARYTVPRVANKDFQLGLNDFSTSLDGSATFYKELVITIPKPQDSNGQYAKYRGWSEKMDSSTPGPLSVGSDDCIKETPDSLVITLTNTYMGKLHCAPIFYWDEEPVPDEKGQITVGAVTAKATYANGATKEAGRALRKLRVVGDELIEITSASRSLRSWYGSGRSSTLNQDGVKWDADKLVYQLGQFFIWNHGTGKSGPKRLIIQYNNTETVGVVRQTIPAPKEQKVTNIKYRTSVGGEWIPYGEDLTSDGSFVSVVLPDDMLENGRYFTEIQADIAEGYPAFYTNHTDGGEWYPHGGCVTFAMLKNTIADDEAYSDFAKLSVIDLPEDSSVPSNAAAVPEGTPTKTYNVTWKPDRGGRIRPDGGSLTKSKIKAGGEGTTVNWINVKTPEYPYNYSETTWDPVIYVRLPEGVPITAWRFERCDGRTGESLAKLSERTDYEVTPTTKDGYTVYCVRFKNFAGAGGWYLDKELNGTYIRFSFDMKANADAAGASLNLHECIFINDGKGDDECVDPVHWISAVADIYDIDGNSATTKMATVSPDRKLEVVAADEALLFYGNNGTIGDLSGEQASQKIFITEDSQNVKIQFVAWNNTTRAVTYEQLRKNNFHFYIPVPQPDDDAFATGNHIHASSNNLGLQLADAVQESSIFQVEYSTDATRSNVDCYRGEAAGAYQEATWLSSAQITDWAAVRMVRVSIKERAVGSIASGEKQTLDLTFKPVWKNALGKTEVVTELQLLPLGSQVTLNPCGNTVFYSGDTLQTAHITLPGYAVSAEVAYGSISGSVYYDTDYDGTANSAASGLTVVATSTKDGVTDKHTTKTDGSGAYHFDGLRFADYEIRVEHPDYKGTQAYSAGNKFTYIPAESGTPYFSNTGNLVELSDAEGKQCVTNVDVPLWAPHTVTFIADSTSALLSDQNLPTVIVCPIWHNSSITPPAINAKEGFVVVEDNKWLPVNGETLNFGKVTASGTFKANVVPNRSGYTVNYLEKDTGKVLHDAKVVPAQDLGTVISSEDIEKIAIDGYNYDSADKDTLTIGTGENVINLYYTKRTDLKYTVNYLEKGSNTSVKDAKVVENQTFETQVTEKAVAIDGYNVDGDNTATITIGTRENVITFYYTKRTDLSYTVKYLEQDTQNELATPKVVTGKTLGDTVTENAIAIDGYNKVETTATTITIKASGNEITFYYTKRTDLSYTVYYLDEETKAQVAGPKAVSNQTFKAEVTENAIDIDGYTKVAPTSGTITIGTGKNEVTFYYTKRTDLSYKVNYLEKGTNTVLQAQKVADKQTFGTTVNGLAEAITIDGYTLDSTDKETLTIGTGENVINLYYTKVNGLTYTVNYLEKVTNKVINPAKVIGNQTFEAEIKAENEKITIEGYNYDSADKETLTIGTNADANVINLYYTKRTDLSYTVNYLDGKTNAALHAAKIVKGQAFESEVTEQAIEIEGYDKVNPTEQKITIGVNDNVITFYYTKRIDLSYTVKYLEQGTTTELADSKTVNGQVFNARVTENAIDITGYNKPTETSQTITIGVSSNEITFYYTKRNDLSYTVKYLEQDTNKKLANEKTVTGQTFEAKVTENAIDIDGYNKVGPTSQTITIGTGKNEVIFYYTKRTDLSYTVNYLEQGTNKVLHEQKMANGQTFEAVIQAEDEAIKIDGYNYVSANKESLTIGTGENVIDLYYAKVTGLSYTVNYLEKGTTKVLKPAQVKGNQTFEDEIKAADVVIDVDGYKYDSANTDMLTIGTDASKNVINLYYIKRTDLSYTVKYLEEDTNKKLADEKTVTGQTFEAEVKEQAIDIEGYNKVSPVEKTVKIAVSGNEITFYYTKRTDLSYTVNYLEQDTNRVLAETKTVNGQTFEAEVTEQSLDIEGYDKVAPVEKTIKIAVSGNEIVFYYTIRQYTVTFDSNGGSTVTSQTVRHNAAASRPTNPTRSGYTFAGWFMNGTAYDFAAPVTGNITLVANWTENGTDIPFIPTPTPTPVTPTPTPTPTPGGTTIIDEETPLGGAVGLNDTDHFAYIAGYEDDTVRPTKNITRAEVAAIFFRLMTEEFRIANWATENTLKDVESGAWYNNAVSTCANAGIITGYTDGRFQPQKDITRAEFAVIAARFLGPDADDEGVNDFSDTAGHWAAAEIRKAAKAGWITGSGNNFRPNDPITRAEVMVIVNRMLDRTPDAGHMLADMKTWIDNPEGTWYYEAVQEATNGHDYERDELNVETWTAIQDQKNWAVIEAEWAANNGASAPRADTEPAEADGESK